MSIDTCASCGRSREQSKLMVNTGRIALCDDCIRQADEGLSRAIDADMRARAGSSESMMAEELALNLMDALDNSRSEPQDWPAPQPQEPLVNDYLVEKPTEPPTPLQPEQRRQLREETRAEGNPPEAVAGSPDEREPFGARTSARAEPLPEPETIALPRKVAAVIPARYASSRFPGKPLHLIAGKPMIQHVYERCVASGVFAEVMVATDDARIADAVAAFGGKAVMTSEYAKSGTDRVAEIAKTREDLTHFVNVQGDEPLIHGEMLGAVAGTFEDPEVEIATLVRPLEDAERSNPNVVKVVLARTYDALYFSRSDIPFQRDADGSGAGGFPHRYAHIGLYGYSRAALLDLSRHAASPLEEVEKLEQLRALELGMKIRCLVTLHRSIGVDTPEDAVRVEELLRTESAAAAPVAP